MRDLARSVASVLPTRLRCVSSAQSPRINECASVCTASVRSTTRASSPRRVGHLPVGLEEALLLVGEVPAIGKNLTMSGNSGIVVDEPNHVSGKRKLQGRRMSAKR
jgi:hypothetical protein